MIDETVAADMTANLLYDPDCTPIPTTLFTPCVSIGETNRLTVSFAMMLSKFAVPVRVMTEPKGETAAVSDAGTHRIARDCPTAAISIEVVLSFKVMTDETVALFVE